MATGAVPMLTRGAFATYFGGPDLLDQLDERSGSIVRYHVKNLNKPQPQQNDYLFNIF